MENILGWITIKVAAGSFTAEKTSYEKGAGMEKTIKKADQNVSSGR
jgi:hypothetical protein